MRPVTVRRWEVVAAFVLLVAVAFGVAAYNDHRISDSEKRINRNRASIVELARTNRRQVLLRKDLIRQGHLTSLAICRETEKIKSRIRTVAHFDPHSYALTLTQLGIDPLSPRGLALLAQARESAQTIQQRFAAKNCRRLTFPPPK